jgi:uncharacterized protein YoxC
MSSIIELNMDTLEKVGKKLEANIEDLSHQCDYNIMNLLKMLVDITQRVRNIDPELGKIKYYFIMCF